MWLINIYSAASKSILQEAFSMRLINISRKKLDFDIDSLKKQRLTNKSTKGRYHYSILFRIIF